MRTTYKKACRRLSLDDVWKLAVLHFVAQQRFFGRKATAETYQVAAAPDYAMAGNDDRDRVAPVCRTNGPNRLRVTYPLCDIAVRCCGSIGDLLQFIENFSLELGAVRSQTKVK
jgi:hypothetical protein